jgi:hypothetical protein
MVICLLRTAGSDGHGLFTPFGKKNVKAAMLGATEGLVLLQAQQLATSLYTFGRAVRDGNRAPFPVSSSCLTFSISAPNCGVSMQMLSNVAIAGLAKIRTASTNSRLLPFRVSRAESFEVLLLREIPLAPNI